MKRGEYGTYEDIRLLALAANDDKRAFDVLYERYFGKLLAFVYNRIHHKQDAEEIVQNVFYSFWKIRSTLVVTTSVSAYLFGACKNLIIHNMRDEKVRKVYLAQLNFLMQQASHNSNEDSIRLHDVEEALERGLLDLPVRCKEIFKLSRQQHQTIPEIAEHLKLSHKTVENNITTALKRLRVSLSEFMTMLVVLVGSM